MENAANSWMGVAGVPRPTLVPSRDPLDGPVPTYTTATGPYAGAVKAVIRGNSLYLMGNRPAAHDAYVAAAGALSVGDIGGAPDNGRLLGMVMHLAYYFALERDRHHAVGLWHRFMDGSHEATPATWQSPLNVVAALKKHRFGDAFTAMLREDHDLIQKCSDVPLPHNECSAALLTASASRYAHAETLLHDVGAAGDTEYAYYALGVVLFAHGFKTEAINAWLSASIANDHPLPDQPAYGSTATRAATMLLKFF
jgi:hypothetical protein